MNEGNNIIVYYLEEGLELTDVIIGILKNVGYYVIKGSQEISLNKNIFLYILLFNDSSIITPPSWTSLLPKESFVSSTTTKSVKNVLHHHSVLCVYLNERGLPAGFDKFPSLYWSNENLQSLTNRLLKFVASSKTAFKVKKALFSVTKTVTNKVEEKKTNYASQHKNLLHFQDFSSDDIVIDQARKLKDKNFAFSKNFDNKIKFKPEFADVNLSDAPWNYTFPLNTMVETENSGVSEKDDDLSEFPHYDMFPQVHPYLIMDSFNAEDDDLTKEELDKMTLTMENVNTLLELNQVKHNEEKCINLKRRKCGSFTSQVEQMKMLDLLQSHCKQIQHKFEICLCNDPKRRHYRRLLNLYNEVIIDLVNGIPNDWISKQLFWLNDFEQINKCGCCDAVFHSQRALTIHFDLCVKTEWKKLLQK